MPSLTAPRITAASVRAFRVPTADAEPFDIAAGPGGFMWFTEYNTTKVGRISPSGQVTEISLPRPSYGGTGITSGPGPAVWLADPAGSADRLSRAAAVTRTPLPSGPGLPFAIAAPGDGSIVVSELTGYYEYSRVLVRVRPGRPATQALTLPDRLSNIDALAAGSAGMVWFTDFGTSQIGELEPGGGFRLFADGAPYAGLSDITLGGPA